MRLKSDVILQTEVVPKDLLSKSADLVVACCEVRAILQACVDATHSRRKAQLAKGAIADASLLQKLLEQDATQHHNNEDAGRFVQRAEAHASVLRILLQDP
jgi:hypothetical protein